MNILIKLRRLWGISTGYSWCARCGLTWNIVDGYMIPYSSSSSMFPICASCFHEATLEEINKYIDALVDSWGIRIVDKNTIRTNAKLSAQLLKEGE